MMLANNLECVPKKKRIAKHEKIVECIIFHIKIGWNAAEYMEKKRHRAIKIVKIW